MKEIELLSLWKSELELVSFDKELMNLEIRKHLKSIDRKIIIRDILEIAVAVLIIPVGIFIAYLLPNLFIKAGAILLIPSAILIIYKILQARKSKKQMNQNESNLVYLENNLTYYQSQKELLNSVIYWYILPPALCALLIITGLELTTWRYLYAMGVTIGMGYFVDRLNKLTVLKKINPLIERLQSEITELKQK